ncbi:MAG: DUF1971 domain-containing protein [Ilumatobacteraceae bacterium]
MRDRQLPGGLVLARRTPLFDAVSLPPALVKSHRTSVWAELRVQTGSVRYVDLEGDAPRDERLEAGDSAVVVPGIEHRIEPSTDAVFYIQFFREHGGPMVPGAEPELSASLSGQWEHRGRDLDTRDEIFVMVTRQYADITQDDLLEPYFDFGPGFIDWHAHIATMTDYWSHLVLGEGQYEIDTLENHRALHEQSAFTPELFDRWLQIFHDTVNGGWSGPKADIANQRASGMAWAMAQRCLGHGVWRPDTLPATSPDAPPDALA